MSEPPEYPAGPLITVEDLAIILKRSLDAVRKMRQLGSLPPAFRVGRRLYWRYDEFMDWLEAQRETEETPAKREYVDPEWMAINDLARATGVEARRVVELVRKGTLPKPDLLDPKWRWERATMTKWLSIHTPEGGFH